MGSNVLNNSESFEMVQFLAGLNEPGPPGPPGSFWGFNSLPSQSVYSYNKVSSWQKAQVTNHSGSTEEADIRTVMAEIIQFGDDDGDGKYNPSTDTTYKRCRLNEADFGFGFTQSSFHPGNNPNITGYKISATGKLGASSWPWGPGPGPPPGPPGPPGPPPPGPPGPPGPPTPQQRKCGGEVTLEYYLTTGAEFDSNGLYLTPQSSKMSVGINKFKYHKVNVNASKSLLALKMYVITETAEAAWKFSSGGSGTMPSVTSKTKHKSKSGGFFSWNGTYQGDGKYHSITSDVEIVTSTGGEFVIQKNQYAAKLLFTFSGGEHESIYWDPTTGYGDVPDPMDWTNIGIAIGVVLGVGLVLGMSAKMYKNQQRRGRHLDSNVKGSAAYAGTTTNYGSV